MRRIEAFGLISTFSVLAAMLQSGVASTVPVAPDPVETWDQFVTRSKASQKKPGWFESISPTASAWFFPRAESETPDWSKVRIDTFL